MLDRLLKYVYRLVRYRAYWVIGVFLVLVVLVLSYIFPFPIRSSLLDLLPQNDPLIEEYKRRKETVNSTQSLTVVLSLKGDGKGKEAANREKLLKLAGVIEPLLSDIPEIGSVNYRAEGSIPEGYEFLYSLDDRTLGELRRLKGELEGSLGGFSSDGVTFDPENPYGDLKQKFQKLESGDGVSEEELRELLNQLEKRNDTVLKRLSSVDRLRDWEDRLSSLRKEFREVREERQETIGGQYFSSDGSTLLLKASPRNAEAHNVQFSRRLTNAARRAVQEAKTSQVFQNGNYRIELTGSFVTNAERNSALKEDMLWTTVISSVAVMIAFFFALGSLFYSTLVALPLIVAVLFALGWAKFSVGGFNLLTTFLPALVLGLSIDYGIHLLFRFSEERLGDHSVSEAIKITIMKKGKGIFIAALTTAAVFTTLTFSRSQGLVEMGIITSLGIMISFFVYLFLLPSLIIAFQRWKRRKRAVELFDYRETLGFVVDKSLKHGKKLLVISLIISILALVAALRLDFQFTSNNVSTEVESVRVQERIRNDFGSSEVSIGPSFVFFPDSIEELEALESGLGKIDIVKSIRSLRGYLPEDFRKLEDTVGNSNQLKRLNGSLGQITEVLENRESEVERLESLVGDLSTAQLSSTMSSRSKTTVRLNEAIDQLLEIRKKLLGVNRPATLKTVRNLQSHLGFLSEGFSSLEGILDKGKGKELVKALPEKVRSTLTTDKGEYVVFAGVEKSIYESDNLNNFVDQASELSEDYFGLPLIQYKLEGHIRHDFIISTTLAVLMISIVLYRGISSIRLSLLAVIPLILGYLWMLAGMKLMGMNFNFINIIISPLLIGIGVDDGLHLIYRWREEEGKEGLRGSILNAFSRTGLAVVTTSITTIVVFGSLFLARTPGLRILGGTALLGIGFAMVLSLTVLPAALYLAFSRGEK
ncbi:MMPL family transporter [Candidatus Bipolaricaulota bacterium]|nr:MMPL family transporter [Candidatus Bipolaricaulota bacterium]